MRNVFRSAALLAAVTLIASGCAETQLGVQLAKSASRDNDAQRGDPIVNSDATIAPEEFDAQGLTIWDGARTLQGVWVAHPLATRARRVRVVNIATGKTVEGAMFRRDPALSGPSILVSSDTANGLGLKPGAPTQLRIVALRDPDAIASTPVTATPTQIETASVETAALPAPTSAPAAAPTFEPAPTPANNNTTLTPAPAAPTVAPAAAPAPVPVPAVPVPASTAVEQTTGASSAPKPQPRPAQLATASTAPTPKPTATTTSTQGTPLQSGDYVQAGAFGVEPNARALVEKLRTRGLPAQYVRRTVNGADLNIVMIGPLNGETAIERAKAEAAAAGVSGARKVTL